MVFTFLLFTILFSFIFTLRHNPCNCMSVVSVTGFVNDLQIRDYCRVEIYFQLLTESLSHWFAVVHDCRLKDYFPSTVRTVRYAITPTYERYPRQTGRFAARFTRIVGFTTRDAHDRQQTKRVGSTKMFMLQDVYELVIIKVDASMSYEVIILSEIDILEDYYVNQLGLVDDLFLWNTVINKSINVWIKSMMLHVLKKMWNRHVLGMIMTVCSVVNIK